MSSFVTELTPCRLAPVTDTPATQPDRDQGKQNRLLSVAKSPPTKLAVNQHCSVECRTDPNRPRNKLH